MNKEEQQCYDELVQAGLVDHELAVTIAKKQAAIRKARKGVPPAPPPKKTTPGTQGNHVEIDYRSSAIAIPGWVQSAIETSLAIDATDAKSAGALGYMARAMVIATLPYKNPKNPDGSAKIDYIRRNGNFTLRIVAGYEGGIPYGVHPRMLLSWIASEAVRRQSPVIELGDSLRIFLRDVLDVKSTSGGSRSSSTLVIEQIKRLFGSIVTATYSSASEGSFALRNVLIANELRLSEREMKALLDSGAPAVDKIASEIIESVGGQVNKPRISETQLWDPQPQKNAGKWHSLVELSPAFYNECITNPVPIDLRAYRALKSAPMAMDIYAWLTYRMSYLKIRSRPIPWEALFMQFGTGIKPNERDPKAAIRDFKKAFLNAAKTVSIVYPDAQFETTPNGLILIPSPTHIPKANPNQGRLF